MRRRHFSCAATDARDAALQAAVAVRTIAEQRRLLSGERPIASHFYDVQVIGPVHTYDLVRARAERAEALAKARAWGLLNDPLVQDADGARGLDASPIAATDKTIDAATGEKLLAPPTSREPPDSR